MPESPHASPFAALLPAHAVTVDASPAMWEGGLYPDEATHVERAVAARRREFTAGRNALRAALLGLGIRVASIPVGPRREPVFPAEVTASITHVDDYCAAAAVRRGAIGSIGIDAERNEELPGELRNLVVATDEADALCRIAAHAGCDPYRLAFGAKEAFYKAYFQRTGHFLEWRDVRIALDPVASTFTIRLTSPAATAAFRDHEFAGRYAVDRRLIYSAIALPSMAGVAMVRATP